MSQPPKRYMPLSLLRKKMISLGYDLSDRTLQRWAKTRRIPATKGVSGTWAVDLRELKSAGDEGRALYEELMVEEISRA